MSQVHKSGGATPMFRQGARSEMAARRVSCQTTLGKAGENLNTPRLLTILHDSAEQIRRASRACY